MTGHSLVYVTTPDEAEAERLAREVVGQRLAACANIIPGMRSFYRWQNKLESAAETVLILKTTGDLAARVMEEVKRLHSCDVPCIVTLPLTGGDPDFLRWIDAETRRV